MVNAWSGVFARAHAGRSATQGASLGLILSVSACVTEDPRFREPGHAEPITETSTSETADTGHNPDTSTEASGRGHGENDSVATDTDESGRGTENATADAGDTASAGDTGSDDGPGADSGEFDSTAITDGHASTDSTNTTDTTDTTDTTATTDASETSDSETEVGTTSTEDDVGSSDESEVSDTGTSEETGDPLPDRWAIELRNPRNEVSSGPARLTFDHAALVAAGLAADGSDLHIWVEDGAPRRVDRILDPQSSWNRSDTQIWFAPPGALGPNEVNSDDFSLRVDAALAVMADGMRVFQLFDHFDDPAESARRWNVLTPGPDEAPRRLGVHAR